VKVTVYRTQQGTVFRITEMEDGSLKVDVLKQQAWVPGPIEMTGLRLAPRTTRLSAAQIRALPA
jgi:hypothetical protein